MVSHYSMYDRRRYEIELILQKKIIYLEHWSKFTAQDRVRAKLCAHLISMTVQLKHLSIAKFQWLLYITENVSTTFIIIFLESKLIYEIIVEN